jgi:hypothetical protein
MSAHREELLSVDRIADQLLSKAALGPVAVYHADRNETPGGRS